MKAVYLIAVVLALAGCASQSVTPVSRPMIESGDRPIILFVNSPAMKSLPQQVIGEERLLDGLS